MVQRRSFIKNSLLLSLGAATGAFNGVMVNTTINGSVVKDNWTKWVENMKGSRLGFLEDVSIFKSDKHDVPFSKFRLEWGNPVQFENGTVVARPLWKYWDNDARPIDFIVLFWEKREGKWQYNRSLHSHDIKALNAFAAENTEGGSFLPRYNASKKEVHAAAGKIQIKTLTTKNGLVSTVKMHQHNGILVEKTIKIENFINLIC